MWQCWLSSCSVRMLLSVSEDIVWSNSSINIINVTLFVIPIWIVTGTINVYYFYLNTSGIILWYMKIYWLVFIIKSLSCTYIYTYYLSDLKVTYYFYVIVLISGVWLPMTILWWNYKHNKDCFHISTPPQQVSKWVMVVALVACHKHRNNHF